MLGRNELYATLIPLLNIEVLPTTPFQVIPSCEVAIEIVFDDEYPTATHIEPFHATPYPLLVNIDVLLGTPVQ